MNEADKINYLETTIDYMIEEIYSMINLGEWIDKKLDNLDTKQEIKQYFKELVDEYSGTSETNDK